MRSSATVRKKIGLVCFVWLVVAWIVVNGHAQEMRFGTIKGKVTDEESGQPLPGANIQLVNTVLGASSDANGNFFIERVPPGEYQVHASMLGYRQTHEYHVQVESGRSVRLHIQLKKTPIEFDPIVVSANKTRQRLQKAPVSLSVVGAKEIARRNATNLIEALETAPGIHFVGNQINIRGSSGYSFGAGNKVLLLLDGVPVYASDTGEFNWEMLPPLDIEQIEIVKGAGSTLWGASALGGVVNVLTKDPDPEGKWLFAFTAGKYGRPRFREWEWTDPNRLFYNRQDVSYSRRFGRLGVRLSVGRFESTGYRQLGDFQKNNFAGKFLYRFPGGANLTFYAGLSVARQGFFVQWKSQNDPYEVDETNLDNYARTNELILYARYAVPLSPKLAFQARASLIRSLMGNQFGDQADFNPAIGQGVEMQLTYLPNNYHTITTGMQFQLDAGSTRFFGSHKGYAIGPYFQDEWNLRPNLTATIGLRYDRYQLVGGLAEDLFSPRLGVNWQPFAATSLRASLGSGFRAATIVERFLELSIMNFKIVANPDLRAERSWAFEVGLRHYFSETWNLDVALFDNEYQDLIEAHLDLIRGQIQFRNVFRARMQGIEASSNWSAPFSIAGKACRPELNLSLTAMNHEDLKYHEPLVYRPKILATAKARLSYHTLMAEIVYRYASKIDAVKIYPINDRVPMKFIDVRLNWTLGKITLQAGINNLTNYNYAPMESNLLPMRTYTVGLRGGF